MFSLGFIVLVSVFIRQYDSSVSAMTLIALCTSWILIVFRGHRKGKFVLNGLMDFFSRMWIFHKFEQCIENKFTFFFLDTHSFQHFQFWKTQGTILLHFAKIYRKRMISSNEVLCFFRLNAFPWTVLLW